MSVGASQNLVFTPSSNACFLKKKKRFAIEKNCAQIAMEKTWDGL